MPLYELDGVRPELPATGRFWIAPDAALIGNVKLEEEASVWFQAVLRGEAELQPRRSDRSPSNWSSGRRRAVRTRRNCAGHWRSTSPATPSWEFFSAPAK